MGPSISRSGKPREEDKCIVDQPKIFTFNGKTGMKEVWVLTLSQVITIAAKKSFRVVERLGLSNTIYGIKLGAFITDGRQQLTAFYNSKQELDESVTTWGCRLEELLYVYSRMIFWNNINTTKSTKYHPQNNIHKITYTN